MFTGTPEEMQQREQRAQQLAHKVAELLGQIDALGLAHGSGQIRTAGGLIRTGTTGWTVTDR
ncbi:hypothetical protein [Streptomyces niveus]|uniref:hypothetical protein n=1 Tax=Streptomyces niveus TaxID=193462 RepID=UPI0003C5FACB|nr:hypothetical protein [Streptomyces niveus]EST17871.1 hypothetical protein M877_40140 [Streptomyces niveus NCIMB 11891]